MIISNIKSEIYSFIRTIFAEIDNALFGFFESILVNLFKIAYADFFSEGFIKEVLNRVYVILGLFLLFKLTFSIINYIINPEMLTDKEKGVGKIITRVVISMSLLVLTPSIFKYAKQAQYYIVDVIPRVILGKNFSTRSDQSIAKEGGMLSDQTLENIAKNISFNSFLVVFNYNAECPLGEEDKNIYNGSDTLTSDAMSQADMISSVRQATAAIGNPCPSDDSKYKYDYTIIIGSVLGIFLIYTMIGITIDIGIRTIKLGVLQLLAPIPIISYIDPKSSKDGSFQNWTKACITTYIDLFIRIGVVYLIIFLVQQVFNGAVLPNSTLLVRICIIVSLFFFVKKAPKFITDVLGLKGDGANIFGEVFTRPLQAGAVGAAVLGGVASVPKNVFQSGRLGFFGRIKTPFTSPFKAVSNAVGEINQIASGDYKFNDLTHPLRTFNDSFRNSSSNNIGGKVSDSYSQLESIDKSIQSVIDDSDYKHSYRGRDYTIKQLKRMAESARSATERNDIEAEIKLARNNATDDLSSEQRQTINSLIKSASRYSHRSLRDASDVHEAAESARYRGMTEKYRSSRRSSSKKESGGEK